MTLTEKVARAICNDGHGRLTWDELPESRRDAWRKMARAAVAVCMEEATAVANAHVLDGDPHDARVTARGIASAIRALSQGERGRVLITMTPTDAMVLRAQEKYREIGERCNWQRSWPDEETMREILAAALSPGDQG